MFFLKELCSLMCVVAYNFIFVQTGRARMLLVSSITCTYTNIIYDVMLVQWGVYFSL